jgi:LacI family transcriptional regulator
VLRSPSRAIITDVAKKAGVSIATVSRVINRTAPVAPETEAQVKAAISELNYRPHVAAQVLAGRKTDTLGLLLPAIGGDFFSLMLRGVESGARKHGLGLLVYSTETMNPRDVTDFCPVGEHNTDGLLAFTDSISNAELRRLHKLHFPIVLLHRSSPEGLNIPCVTVENKSGACEAVDHLINEHGCRRIGFLTGPEGHEDSWWRELGYRESLAAHAIPFDPALVAMGAIFAGDDEAAAGVLTALSRAGKRVPGDVALVGFDDTHFSRYLSPPLTTVHAPIEQVGQEAVRQLVALVRTRRAEPLVMLPTRLVVRRSCGCR